MIGGIDTVSETHRTHARGHQQEPQASDRALGLEAKLMMLSREFSEERERSAALATALDGAIRRLDALEASATRLSGPADEADPAMVLAIAVKMEVASLREAVLGRTDDRSHFTLAMEDLRQDCQRLSERADEQAEMLAELRQRIEAMGRDAD
jgi:methyl-accepting chemotaxis protein